MSEFFVITDRSLCAGDFLTQIELLADAGADAIVLREKDLSESEYTDLARQVLAVCREYQTECILHNFFAAAREIGAKSIHLPLSAAVKYRDKLSDFDRVGVSVHSPAQLEQAKSLCADDVFYGHVFATDCKKNVPPRGTAALRKICQSADIPVYAIGGLTPQNAKEALDAGAAGVCVMSFAMRTDKSKAKEFIRDVHRYGKKNH